MLLGRLGMDPLLTLAVVGLMKLLGLGLGWIKRLLLPPNLSIFCLLAVCGPTLLPLLLLRDETTAALLKFPDDPRGNSEIACEITKSLKFKYNKIREENKKSGSKNCVCFCLMALCPLG